MAAYYNELKTSGYDRPKIDKSKRVQDLARNIRSRPFRPLPGTKASNIKLSFSHDPIYRDSGKLVFERMKE